MAVSRDRMNSLNERLSSGSISLLCLLIVLSGYTFWFGRRPHYSLDDGPSLPTVRLDRATLVGKHQGQTETFQGIPYARPPCVPFCPQSLQIISWPKQRWKITVSQTGTHSLLCRQDPCHPIGVLLPPDATKPHPTWGLV
jgi:hypothetical protein